MNDENDFGTPIVHAEDEPKTKVIGDDIDEFLDTIDPETMGFGDVLDIKEDLIMKFKKYKNLATFHYMKYRHEYNNAFIYTDWEAELNNSQPTEKVKKAYAELQSENDRRFYRYYDSLVEVFKYQISLLDDYIGACKVGDEE